VVPVAVRKLLGEIALRLVRFARRLVAVLAVLTAVPLLAGFLSAWLPLADSFGHFRFHLVVAMAIATGLLLLFRAWWGAVAAGAVAVSGIVGLGPALPFWQPAETGLPGSSITLVQLNLSFRNRTPEAVAEFILREGADVVTLQEVTRDTGRVMDLLQREYPNRIRCPYATVGGVAVMSRLPKADGPSEGCVELGGLAWIRVMAGGRPLSVASVHLDWPYPFSQAPQVDRLTGRLASIPRPIVVAGDFNATPWSHAVARMAKASDTEVAGGLRLTFPLRPLSWAPAIDMPIDQVLLPDSIVPTALSVGPGPGSDHRSVIARLLLPPGPGLALAPPRDGQTTQQ